MSWNKGDLQLSINDHSEKTFPLPLDLNMYPLGPSPLFKFPFYELNKFHALALVGESERPIACRRFGFVQSDLMPEHGSPSSEFLSSYLLTCNLFNTRDPCSQEIEVQKAVNCWRAMPDFYRVLGFPTMSRFNSVGQQIVLTYRCLHVYKMPSWCYVS